MDKYQIKLPKRDFRFLEAIVNIKGSRRKRMVIDNNGKKAIFKYEGEDYLCSEACSEKISYEIAVLLGYECAKIELARDDDGNL